MKKIDPIGTKHYGHVCKGRSIWDGRISIDILFFDVEEDAKAVAAAVRAEGASYNGGWFHGSPCGREEHRDFTDESGTRWFAVTC